MKTEKYIPVSDRLGNDSTPISFSDLQSHCKSSDESEPEDSPYGKIYIHQGNVCEQNGTVLATRD